MTLINPLTGHPPVEPKERCGDCTSFYELAIAGAGVQNRCVRCGFFVEWKERYERKAKGKKKPTAEGG